MQESRLRIPTKIQRLWLCVILAFTAAGPASSFVHAQQPFNTDDADVTDYHKLHVEIGNEYDTLQRTSFPNLRQNTANIKFAYGMWKRVEIGLDEQLISIFNAPGQGLPRKAVGYGDVDLSVKYNFYQAREHSHLPALTISAAFELPTGDATRQLGSGLTDYAFNLISQSSLTERTKLRLNSGFVLAGNSQTGVIGIATRGTVYTGAVSLIRDFNPKLKLGVEMTGELTAKFDLARGQLQNQVGGNHHLTKSVSLDFGMTVGYYAASPRLGPQIGISVDF
jgi:hypothetical protein